MPRHVDEKSWQYARRMADLADRIRELVRGAQRHHRVWRFSEVAQQLGQSEEDVRIACGTLGFTAEFHVRDADAVFFAKSREEISDDLDWTLGTGYYDQGEVLVPEGQRKK